MSIIWVRRDENQPPYIGPGDLSPRYAVALTAGWIDLAGELHASWAIESITSTWSPDTGC
jgi:hypothetical protein